MGHMQWSEFPTALTPPKRAAGVPSIVFGPGSIQQAHTRDEFIDIEQLEKAAEVYYQMCIRPVTTAARSV